MNIVSANIKGNPKMSQARVLHDVRAVHNLGDVIGWQEIHLARYTQAVTSQPGLSHVYTDTECPISYKTSFWEPEGTVAGHVRTHDGRSLVTPARYFTYICLRRKNSVIPPVVFMNTHMISSAWSNRHPLTKAWRRRMWERHFRIQKQKVIELNNRGFTVIGTGDTNRGASMPKFVPHQRWLSQGGIDHIWCVEAPHGAKVELHEQVSWPGQVYTDHHPRIAKIKLS